MSDPVYKRPESVLVLIHTRAGEVLLLERVRPPGFWQSVTGSLEPGESTLTAAYRELEEETGLMIEDGLIDCQQTNSFPIHPDWRARYAPDVSHNTEHVFRLELLQAEPIRLQATEHSRYLWLPRLAAADRASSHTNRDAILRFVPDLAER